MLWEGKFSTCLGWSPSIMRIMNKNFQCLIWTSQAALCGLCPLSCLLPPQKSLLHHLGAVVWATIGFSFSVLFHIWNRPIIPRMSFLVLFSSLLMDSATSSGPSVSAAHPHPEQRGEDNLPLPLAMLLPVWITVWFVQGLLLQNGEKVEWDFLINLVDFLHHCGPGGPCSGWALVELSASTEEGSCCCEELSLHMSQEATDGTGWRDGMRRDETIFINMIDSSLSAWVAKTLSRVFLGIAGGVLELSWTEKWFYRCLQEDGPRYERENGGAQDRAEISFKFE